MEKLAAAGLVWQADVGPGATRYEIGQGWHHHFVCRTCGSLVDVPCQADSPCLQPDPGLDLQIDRAQIIFRGTCADCRPAAAMLTRSRS